MAWNISFTWEMGVDTLPEQAVSNGDDVEVAADDHLTRVVRRVEDGLYFWNVMGKYNFRNIRSRGDVYAILGAGMKFMKSFKDLAACWRHVAWR